MKVGSYVVRPDGNCWIVATLKTFITGSRAGQEYETDVVYPARFDGALKTLLDRLVRDGIQPDDTLERAVEKVTLLYEMIGSKTWQDSFCQNVPEGVSRS